jgi:hypothetical protein
VRHRQVRTPGDDSLTHNCIYLTSSTALRHQDAWPPQRAQDLSARSETHTSMQTNVNASHAKGTLSAIVHAPDRIIHLKNVPHDRVRTLILRVRVTRIRYHLPATLSRALDACSRPTISNERVHCGVSIKAVILVHKRKHRSTVELENGCIPYTCDMTGG